MPLIIICIVILCLASLKNVGNWLTYSDSIENIEPDIDGFRESATVKIALNRKKSDL